MPTPRKPTPLITAPEGSPTHSTQVKWDTKTHDEFCFFHLDLDVRAAKRLLAKAPRKVVLVPLVEQVALSRFIVLLTHTYRPVDLTVPLVIGRFRMALEGKRRTAQLIIDGWHRVGEAYKRGVTHLPAVFLTVAESRALRID